MPVWRQDRVRTNPERLAPARYPGWRFSHSFKSSPRSTPNNAPYKWALSRTDAPISVADPVTSPSSCSGELEYQHRRKKTRQRWLPLPEPHDTGGYDQVHDTRQANITGCLQVTQEEDQADPQGT